MRLAQKVALITGAASGFGRASAPGTSPPSRVPAPARALFVEDDVHLEVHDPPDVALLLAELDERELHRLGALGVGLDVNARDVDGRIV